jgi:uncharacterized Zn finger protein (UPF0148 family)
MSRDRVVRRTCLGSHHSIYEWANSERPGEDGRAACPVCGKLVLTEARTGKMPTHAPPLGHITRVVKISKEPDMQTNQTPEALAEECQRLANQLGATSLDRSTEAELRDAINRLRDMAASGAKDAERLDFIASNARRDPKMDGQHVWWPTTFNAALRGPTLREAIDAAIAATKRGEG